MAYRFPLPPPISPSAIPALGVGLCFNTLLAAALVMCHGWFGAAPDEFMKDLVKLSVPSYAVLCLVLSMLYGVAGAAWTGWSWWRVPFATLAAAALGWCVNIIALSWWSNREGWASVERLAWTSSTVHTVTMVAIMSAAALFVVWLTLLPRWWPRPIEAVA